MPLDHFRFRLIYVLFAVKQILCDVSQMKSKVRSAQDRDCSEEEEASFPLPPILLPMTINRYICGWYQGRTVWHNSHQVGNQKDKSVRVSLDFTGF